MANAIDITGHIFGRLRAIRVLHDKGYRKWECLCICGNNVLVMTGHLTQGHTQSCGCIKHDELIERNTKHGQATRAIQTREYKAWKGMNKRCYQVNSKSYKWYGAKGIAVSDAWRYSYAQFFQDMNVCPAGYELDRIDNTLGYNNDNCRWVDEATQARNRGYVKLSFGDAEAIRNDPRPSRAVAKTYGVSKSAILAVRNGKTWKVLNKTTEEFE